MGRKVDLQNTNTHRHTQSRTHTTKIGQKIAGFFVCVCWLRCAQFKFFSKGDGRWRYVHAPLSLLLSLPPLPPLALLPLLLLLLSHKCVRQNLISWAHFTKRVVVIGSCCSFVRGGEDALHMLLLPRRRCHSQRRLIFCKRSDATRRSITLLCSALLCSSLCFALRRVALLPLWTASLIVRMLCAAVVVVVVVCHFGTLYRGSAMGNTKLIVSNWV